MAKLIQVRRSEVKTCEKCGYQIAFHKNRNGKSYPVEVEYHESLGPVYRSGIGAYGNLTPWHDCKSRSKQVADVREKLIRDDLARQFLPRLMDLAQNWSESRREEAEAVNAEYLAALAAAGL